MPKKDEIHKALLDEAKKDPTVRKRGTEFLTLLATTYATKAGSFATIYFTMLFGVYAVMAISIQLWAAQLGLSPTPHPASILCPSYLILYISLAGFLLGGALISAIQYYAFAAMSADAIQLLQEIQWDTKNNPEKAITTLLVKHAGFLARLSEWLHGVESLVPKFVFSTSYVLTVVLAVVIWVFLGSCGLDLCSLAAELWPYALLLIVAFLVGAAVYKWHKSRS